MAWGETSAWIDGTENRGLYQELLDDATSAPERNAQRKKVVHPHEMPWEMSRQGLLKHLINEAMNTRMETVDAYMQIIPPGSRSLVYPAGTMRSGKPVRLARLVADGAPPPPGPATRPGLVGEVG